MCEDLYYNLTRSRLGLATIINNLEAEQEPTKKDVEVMGNVLRDIGLSSVIDNYDAYLRDLLLHIKLIN